MDKKKPKLTYEEQLKKLQELKINYDETQTNEVLHVLKNSSYFFKVTSYRKNYEKTNGYNVDFKALQDLAKLDMKLRYTLLPFCLDVEHSIKTFLMRIITNDDKHDGYEFVERVVNLQPNPEGFKKELFRSVSVYKKGEQVIIDEFQKYYDKTPIWLVLEFATVNKLKPFIIELSTERPNNTTLNRIRTYIYFVGLLRNDCAHNTPLIFDLKRRLRTREIHSNARRDGLTNQEIQMGKLISIYAVLKLHLELCSDGMKIHQADNLRDYLKRLKKTVSLYDDNPDLKIFFNGIEKIFQLYIYSVDGKR
ncbi:Abi family protein (plasmid) [Vagococcus lutrae]|uniref:Abi family protein n=1 Tax=Vagococcus lutrae TaxID=81947 RepID=UPI001C96A2FB|nr:Abi family protein [Vagococcus lutrae]QZN89747.1 Abi family protein [Vagococcus lutrae]